MLTAVIKQAVFDDTLSLHIMDRWQTLEAKLSYVVETYQPSTLNVGLVVRQLSSGRAHHVAFACCNVSQVGAFFSMMHMEDYTRTVARWRWKRQMDHIASMLARQKAVALKPDAPPPKLLKGLRLSRCAQEF